MKGKRDFKHVLGDAIKTLCSLDKSLNKVQKKIGNEMNVFDKLERIRFQIWEITVGMEGYRDFISDIEQ